MNSAMPLPVPSWNGSRAAGTARAWAAAVEGRRLRPAALASPQCAPTPPAARLCLRDAAARMGPAVPGMDHANRRPAPCVGQLIVPPAPVPSPRYDPMSAQPDDDHQPWGEPTEGMVW